MAKRKQEEPKAGAPEWLATYGDLMTLVLCFFVLLYAMSSIDVDKFNAMASALSNSPVSIMPAGSSDGISQMLGSGIMEMPIIESNDTVQTEELIKSNKEFEEMTSDFKTYFAENAMAEKIEVESTEEYMKITFLDGVLFDSGKADIKPEALDALEFIANELLKHPDNQIEIEGHTDTDPISTSEFKSNWYLSGARAIKVGEYFINVKGFSPARISPLARGEYWPIAPNDTPANKAKNRRVEIYVRSLESID